MACVVLPARTSYADKRRDEDRDDKRALPFYALRPQDMMNSWALLQPA